MKFKHKTEEEIQSMFLLPEGTYQFVVTKAEDAMSKSNNEMIKLTLKIMDKSGREHTVYDYLLEAMEFKLKHFCDATGLEKEYQSDMLLAKHCEGKSGMVDIIVQKGQPNPAGGNYADKNSVKDYIKRTSGQKTQNELLNQSINNDFNDEVPF